MKKKSPKKVLLTKVPELEDDVEFHEEEEEEEKPEKKKKQKGMVALKHQKVMDNIAKNVGKGRLSVTQAAKDAGYSKSYAESGRIKNTRTWDQMVEERLSDELLSKTHLELMGAKKIEYMLFNSDITDDQIYMLIESVGAVVKLIAHGIQGTHVYFFCPDNRVRKDATELAYKVRGKMKPDQLQVEVSDIRKLSDEELAEKIKKAKSRFRKTD